MADIEKRLSDIERRLVALEARLGLQAPTAPAPNVPLSSDASPFLRAAQAAVASRFTPKNSTPPTDTAAPRSAATTLLGWGGATALVLAAAYLIRLAVESGWLTPARQIGLAVLGALILIGVGLWLRKSDRAYASLLPAGGVVILFLAIYGAHLYYPLIGATFAAVAVVLVCVASLWLCRVFNSDLYALFAALGSYSAPFLLPTFRANLVDLVIYFSCWSVVFSIFSILVGKRRIYLFALYLALIAFDAAWRLTGARGWGGALAFQTVHLFIFATTAVLFTIRQRAPMTTNVAVLHLPALLIFYFLQYWTLKIHLPAYAPWIAAASAAFIGLCYFVARRTVNQDLPGGRLLLGAYVALVLFHAGYIESVPAAWAPWFALFGMLAVAGYGFARRDLRAPSLPVWLMVGVIFVVNYMRIVVNVDLHQVPARALLSVLYAVEFYAAYVFLRRANAIKEFQPILLYAGHICAIATAAHYLNSRVLVSLAWGVLAVACLVLALNQRDKILGQSSLLIFAACAGKVLLYDLSSAAPLLRIGSLIVVGVTFYLGGWLYQKVTALEPDAIPGAKRSSAELT